MPSSRVSSPSVSARSPLGKPARVVAEFVLSKGDDTCTLRRRSMKFRTIDELFAQLLQLATVPIQKVGIEFVNAPLPEVASIVGFRIELSIGGGSAVRAELPDSLLSTVLTWLSRHALAPGGDLFLMA